MRRVILKWNMDKAVARAMSGEPLHVACEGICCRWTLAKELEIRGLRPREKRSKPVTPDWYQGRVYG